MAELLLAAQVPDPDPHLRSEPGRVRPLVHGKGRATGLEALGGSPEALAIGFGEGDHGAPGEFQPSVLRLPGEEGDRSEVAGRGADDDELAGREGLRLDPGPGRAAPVAAAQLLRDDPFRAHRLGRREEAGSAALDMVAEEDRPAGRVGAEQGAEALPPSLDGLAAKVAAVEVEEVERHEDEAARPPAGKLASKGFEIGKAARILDDHLAVDDRASALEPGGDVEDRAVEMAPVVPSPRIGAAIAAAQDELGPVAVIFELVKPLAARRRFPDEGRHHGLDEPDSGGETRHRPESSCGRRSSLPAAPRQAFPSATWSKSIARPRRPRPTRWGSPPKTPRQGVQT